MKVKSFVALDLETTGLDLKNDAIIEIGAIRFNLHRVEGEWETLIHPGRRIPPFITQLTGITEQMVINAPSIQDVILDLEHFIGNSPIVGHNVKFDAAFLRRYKICRLNDLIDTYDMASVMLPGASRYNLGALSEALSILQPVKHRALDDAKATRGIFLRLYEEILQLPLPILAEIVRLGEEIDWGGQIPFSLALQERHSETVNAQEVREVSRGALFSTQSDRPIAPLMPNPEPVKLDTEEVASILEPGGEFAHHFPEYEYRTQQVEMLRAITDALSDSHHLMVEAGTGVGKSIAYLIPAAMWAIKNNQRVIISTNTINLQDQLIHKDIPDLQAALKWNIRATVLKGRSNYICPRRLENMRRRGPNTPDEMRVFAKVLVWLQWTKTGDRGELNLNSPAERLAWMRLSAEDENCTAENCIKHTGGRCPYYQAHLAAQSAHIIIVNHALLLADVAANNRVLPEYNYLIIDEAHHLEDAVTDALSFHITQRDIERTIKELGGPTSGVLGWLLSATGSILDPSEYAALNQLVQRITDYAFQFDNLAREFFHSIDYFLSEQRDGRQIGKYPQQERILPATRKQPSWENVEIAWEETQQPLKLLLKNLANTVQGVGEIIDTMGEEDQDLFGALSGVLRDLNDINNNLDGLVFTPESDRVYWAEAQPNNNFLSLHAAPLHIGQMMERYLWHEKESVILTSATLTTAGKFDYMKGRLNAIDADEIALGSPFDFENSTLLYLVNDIPEPSDYRGHQNIIENCIISLSKAIGGRTLVLFTSYDQLRRTSKKITPVLSKENILTFVQGDGASPHVLLENFRTTDRAILLGTRSFWEGVDIPGDALSSVVIAKLPFDVPSDPIIAARSEMFEDSFYQYTLPEAILRFRQGFGRLIRTQYDRGIVVILDRRVLTKQYGRFFIESLPACTIQNGRLSDLPRLAQQWLNI
jgi:DNA polymerase-3 subunit epsilon/ATP-dependent DNA helicase DinG